MEYLIATNNNAQNPIMFFVSALTFIVLCGIFFIANVDAKTWRNGIFVGICSSGYSAIGFVAPIINPIPCLVYAAGLTTMLVFVFVNYYKTPIPSGYSPEQIQVLSRQRTVGITRMGIGLGFVLFLSAIIAFSSGQKDGQVITGAFGKVVYQLSKEVNTLHDAVDGLRKEVRDFRRVQAIQAHKDSITDGLLIRNQKKVIENTSKLKR